MKNITVSISSYNQAEYLPEAIESVLNQKFMVGDLQLIVVDDGSTDNSLSIANAHRSNWLKNKNAGIAQAVHDFIVISQVNKGLSSARNTGIMNATGDYFLPLDSDDILDPKCIHTMWSMVNKYFPPDIIAPSMKCFGRANETVILMDNPTLEDFKTGNRIPYCSAVKLSLLKEVGGYSPRMTVGYEDYHLWFNLLNRGAKIVTIPEPLFNYRTKEQSMWHDAVKHHETLMAQINKDFPFMSNIISDPLPK
jgi:glycosyltransferase involved in cell wall biosynthesis